MKSVPMGQRRDLIGFYGLALFAEVGHNLNVNCLIADTTFNFTRLK